ncbi:DUF3892 domain-containing protein [Escherichia coli]|nr:DUF3892 domain-containing protein [Escherichia coli]
MADVRITCITLSGSQSIHEHITHVGSPQFNTGNGKWTVEQVINDIDNNLHTFYVTDNAGNRVEVGVVNPGNGGRQFIRTYADNRWNNNLLSLPVC